MAGPTLSRFLGLFRLRDASDPTRVATVGAGGEVATADAAVAALLAGNLTSASKRTLIALTGARTDTELKNTAGAAGDRLVAVRIQPTLGVVSPGAVSFKDGSGGAAVNIFIGGTNSRANDNAFTVYVDHVAKVGPLLITVGSGIDYIYCSGEFS